jgi:hypothetical protein
MGGGLDYSELVNAVKNRPLHAKLKYFVETGTYHGDTSMMASQHFQKVFTTEIMPSLYNMSKTIAESKGIDNIEFMLGDSVKLLHQIMPHVVEGAVFFIDAHQSGGDTGNNGKNVPLLEELDVILGYKPGPSVYIVDDLRLWKGEVWDWAHVTNKNIVKKFKEHGQKVLSYFEENDRFYVITNGLK